MNIFAVDISPTTSTTMTTTTTTPPPLTSALWSFDNTAAESNGVYNGALMNGAAYSAPSSTVPYVGQGQALMLNASSSQSLEVTSPVFNLAYTSFTIEAWIYASSVAGDVGIFGQCQCGTCANQCFFFIIRGSRLTAGFTLNDVGGTRSLIINTWYHVAFVYNYDTQQQVLYVNGVQDNAKSGAGPYIGTTGSTTIGSAQVSSSTKYFGGYIDNLRAYTWAKSAQEILIDATVIAYYSFDLPSPDSDTGPNGLTGTLVNAATVTGRVNQGLQLTGSPSYFQAYGFYQLGFGVRNNMPYSISLWFNPSSYSSSTLIQQSTQSNSSWCYNPLGIYSPAGSTAQLVGQGYAWPTIYGPFITINTWTHVSWTFSVTNGYKMYVNGAYFGSTGPLGGGGASGLITWLQVGYAFYCGGANVPVAAFQGIVDEVYAHSREITASEVAALANP